MSDNLIVRFVRFEAKALVREYTFTVIAREPSVEQRQFTLTITNEAFESHRVRYQDAPDVCSIKLRRELSSDTEHPTRTHFLISDTELEDYRSAHTHKPLRKQYARKAAAHV